MKTDAEMYREALVELLPVAAYAAKVAERIKLKGFSRMVAAVRNARRVLAVGYPAGRAPGLDT